MNQPETSTDSPQPLALVDDLVANSGGLLPDSRHKEAVERAVQEFETNLGRPPTLPEVSHIETALRDRTVAAIVSRADGRPDWRGETLDDLPGSTFGVNVSAHLPAIVGSGERAYWSEGELAIMYGGDGTNKTTVAHNFLAAMLRLNGRDTVLGQPVRELQPGERVLYLALDRPRQIERSWSRFMDPAEAERVGDHVVWRTSALPFDPVRQPLWLLDWVHDAYPGTYAVIFDNVWDAFGDFSDTEAATAAGIGLNALARSGVHVLALHHDRKGDGARSAPENADGMYGGRNFKAKAGTVVNLWKPPTSDGSILTVTQHKEPSERIPATTVFVNQKTGDLIPMTTGLISLEDFLKAQASEWHDIKTLASVHRATDSPDKADKEATRRELHKLIESGNVTERESDGPGKPAAWKWSR